MKTVFRVSCAPVEQAPAVIAAHPSDWVDRLPHHTVEFDSERFARGWMERNAWQALHKHFVLSKVRVGAKCEEEISREVVEL